MYSHIKLLRAKKKDFCHSAMNYDILGRILGLWQLF